MNVPTDQAPVFYVPGPHGGYYISLLYGFGMPLRVSMHELRNLLAESRGEVILARRLTRTEVALFESRRLNCDVEAHASIITKEEAQFQRPRRGDDAIAPAKLAARGAAKARDGRGKHSEERSHARR